ncbi:hypothetical protein PTMSG1_07820 [Pyrenophora teres f. maculata]|nr:hypothetical protein PTMSG1_07820 [Pyrenophora teres f. maculata]
MSTTNNPYLCGRSASQANDHHGPSQNNVQRVSKIAYGRTSTSPYNLAALPSQEFAQHNWPPSVYQAAQYSYHAPLTFRRRDSEVAGPSASTGEIWPTTQTVTTSSYSSQILSPTLPQMVSSQRFYVPNPYTITEYIDTPSQHPSLDPNVFTETAENRHDRIPLRRRPSGEGRPKSEGDDVQGLYCSLCDDISFTGYYARRNYNRHMERHKDPKSIRCDKPECAKTFGRKDALLVHLRRSHPELDVPPAKKRKNGNPA